MNIKTYAASNGMSFTVYQSKSGNFGARLTNGNFSICSFLNAETGDALFATHPVLGQVWSQVKSDLIALGGMHGKVQTRTTRTLDQIDNRVELTPSASFKRGPGRPRKIAAEQVQAAPVQTAPTQSQPDLFKILEQLTIRVNALTESVELISGVK